MSKGNRLAFLEPGPVPGLWTLMNLCLLMMNVRNCPRVGNVAQLPLGKVSGCKVRQAGPTSMDGFSRGESGLRCT